MMKSTAFTSRNRDIAEWLVLFMVLAAVLYVRIRLVDVALERDEGEYAYIGQLLLKGYAPFSQAYSMKLPGVGMMYALFMMFFGQSATAIHVGLLLVNSLCILFVFLLAWRLVSREAGLIACACYALLSLSESVLGVFAHATHFIVVFMLAGSLLLLRALDSRRLPLFFFSGLCFGLSFLMKQHALLFVVFACGYLLWRFVTGKEKTKIAKAGLVFLPGVVIPYLVLMLYLFKSGVFGQFWVWTVQYSRAYTGISAPVEGLMNFVNNVAPMYPLFPIFALMGGGIVACCNKRTIIVDRPFVLGLFVFSFLAVCPGFYFRPHYFVLFLPAVAILAGAGAVSIAQRCNSTKFGMILPVLLLSVSALFFFICERDYALRLGSFDVSQRIYGPADNFNAAPRIAELIKADTTAADRVAVIGSEPEIYFYADRLSAVKYIYLYSLLEDQPYAKGMETEFTRQIESAAPKYIVVDNTTMLLVEKSPLAHTLFDWLDRYLSEGYECVGAVDLRESDAIFFWDKAVAQYETDDGTAGSITVFRRCGHKTQPVGKKRKLFNGYHLPGI